MTEIVTLTRSDLERLLATVLEMNGREAGQIQFCDQSGVVTDVSLVHVACTSKGLTVFPPPKQGDETPEQVVRRFSQMPADSRVVMQAASMEELETLVRP